MRDTIYRDDAIRVASGYCHWTNIPNELAKLPSAEPEIIRCKNCKHYQFADNRAFGMPVKMCEWFGFEDVDDDDFCSRAERRTERDKN